MGLGRNNGDHNLLDFVLEGQTKGWVAIGFSKTASMVWMCVNISCIRLPELTHTFNTLVGVGHVL